MTLLDRIIAAEGPDRALFEEAFDLRHPAPRSEDEPPWQGAGTLREPLYHEWRVAGGKFKAMLDAEAWTSAAEMLLPEGSEWELTTIYGVARAAINLNLDSGPSYGANECGNPALALLAAIMKIGDL